MKINYKFADGTIAEVEVSEDIGTFIVDSRRLEDNLERKERYHTYSLDAIVYEGEEYAAEETPESECLRAELNKQLQKALSTLTDTQKRRLLMAAEGLSYREIARREGVSDHKKIIKSIEAARKKIKNSF